MNNIEWLRQRLTEPLPGIVAQEKMMGRVIPTPPQVPEHARLSAVLCLLYPADEGLRVLLMKRMADRTAHSGQVSFPGGRYEPTDITMQTTALRETHEEVGIPPTQIEVLGSLTSLYIPVSNFNVFPFVGYMDRRPEYSISKNEVSHLIEPPLSYLLDDRNKVTTDVSSPAMPGMIRNVKAYQLNDGTIVWGATAMILSELEIVVKEYNEHNW